MTRGRVTGAAVGVAVLAVVAVAYLLHRDGRAEAGPGSVAEDTPAEVVAAVLGDSYTADFGLDDLQDGYVHHLVEAMGWRATIDGIPGSGFLNPTSSGGQTFGDRVQGIPQGAAVAVIQGGLNDTDRPDEVRAAAAVVLRVATERARRVVVVGPPAAPGLALRVPPVDAALAAAAADTGAEYVSTLDWELSYDDDGVHLSPEGHRQFADLLTRTLR